ncbi:hypothetical protein BFP97_06460 [Roseivirga sp. 4D4]|uniref:GNAT family N-acetyltransferase n=1 Tax=Roseivirga sp. 4D4 TaxID=1889784 RepID=UPI000852C561|nr:GNAT family N-acetyltransferase [Roseivirga sp. 4D4]OEK01174.1 hypothetical protein BFP97_06460 [Roseivirga sp. 4D4]
MVRYEPFNNTDDFFEQNGAVIEQNYFVFHNPLRLMFTEGIDVFRLYNLIGDEGSHAYCIWLSGNYYIVSFGWSEEIIEALNEQIEIAQFRNFVFTGHKDLLLSFLEVNNAEYRVLKDRIIYECLEPNALDNLPGNLVLASPEDLDELGTMSFEYHQAEYEEEAFRDEMYMRELVEAGIENGNIYKLVEGGVIYSMAQVIYNEPGPPLIGMLFTKPDFRGQGHATSLVHKLTSTLIDGGSEKCGLMSDAVNEASNRVFVKVGYVPIYNQLSVSINEGQ